MTPPLDSAADTELARVLGEYADRLGRGETPDPDDYADRYPHLAEALRELQSVFGLLPKAAPPDAPPALSGFRIVREAGRGGMGVVYEAVEEALGRRVALKALPPQAVAHPQSLDRFRREARAAARLHHTHIVPVFGVGEQAGVHYYVMQFVEGKSLAGFIADGAAPPAGESRPRFAARVGTQVADALAYAHAQGVLHRDVKPANVLLDPAGQPYLTDFGLAKLAGGDDLTGTGDFVGTLRYAAPEQLRNAFDERGDVYGLGATLYELVTGRPPFAATDREALVKQIAASEPPRPRALDRAVPRDLETVILTALAKEPDRRYRSAAELAADLRRVLADEPVKARRTGPVGRGWRWCRRNPVVAGLAAAVVVALAAAAAAAGVGYAHTTDALNESEQHRKEAVTAGQEAVTASRAAEREQQKAVRSDADARAALARMLATIRKTHEIVDAFPDGYLVLTRAEARQSTSAVFGWDHQTTEADRLIEVYGVFVRDAVPDPEVRLEQARAWRRLGFLHFESGRPADAERAMREAVAAADDALGYRPPGDPDYRRPPADEARFRLEAAVCRTDAAWCRYVISRRTPPTWKELTAARDRLVQLAADDPTDPAPPSEVGRLDQKIAHASGTQSQTLHYFTSAITWQKKALALADTPVIRSRLNGHYAEKVRYAQPGPDRVGALVALLREWAGLWPDSPDHTLRVARAAAYFAKSTQVAADRGRYAAVAVDLFRRWLRLGGRDATALEAYAKTPGLGDRPDFRAVLAGLKPATAPAPRRASPDATPAARRGG